MKALSKYDLELLGRALIFAKDAWLVSKPDVDPFDFEWAYPVDATDADRKALDADLLNMLESLETTVIELYDSMARVDKLVVDDK